MFSFATGNRKLQVFSFLGIDVEIAGIIWIGISVMVDFPATARTTEMEKVTQFPSQLL